DEDLHCRTVVCGFGFGDVDRLGVEIDRVDLAVGIDSLNLQNVTAVGPDPAAVQRVEIIAASTQKRSGGSDPNQQHERDSDKKFASPARLGARVGNLQCRVFR